MKSNDLHRMALTQIKALFSPLEGMVFSWVSKDIPPQAHPSRSPSPFSAK